MTSMEKLQPFFDAYSQKIRQRRNDLGMTAKTLSEKSGVPYSNICRVDSGTQANPLLYNAAATADTLGLSLDELCGLPRPVADSGKLKERNNELEIENARLLATNGAQRAQIKSTHTICYVLLFISAMLAVSLVAYLVIDAQIKKGRSHPGRNALRARLGIYRSDRCLRHLRRHRDPTHHPA